MSRLKTFAKYVVWIILFWILSDILIYYGVNSTYKDIKNKTEIPNQVEVKEAEATKVNGRIKLSIENEELSGKYIKIDLYSDMGNVLGTQYIEIGNISKDETKNIETYFKISDIKAYEISIVDEMGETTEGFMDTAMSAMTIFVFVVKLLFV